MQAGAKPWTDDERKAALELLKTWNQNTTWYLIDSKHSLQAFATVREIDLSSRRLVREEYLEKIIQNKVMPVSPARNFLPPGVILGLSVAGLEFLYPNFRALPVEVKALCYSVAVLLVISNEIHFYLQKRNYQSALTQFNMSPTSIPTP